MFSWQKREERKTRKSFEIKSTWVFKLTSDRSYSHTIWIHLLLLTLQELIKLAKDE